MQSGKPVGVFRTNKWAPRVLLANSNLVGDWATWPEFRKLEAEGLMTVSYTHLDVYKRQVEGCCAGAMFVLRGEDPEYPTTVMHLFLATSFRGRRIGEEALALAIRDEFADGITRVTLDPNAHNEGAIRSYERLGFKRVGVLRDYQVRPGGHLEDALFMDLTRSDFPEGPPLPPR